MVARGIVNNCLNRVSINIPLLDCPISVKRTKRSLGSSCVDTSHTVDIISAEFGQEISVHSRSRLTACIGSCGECVCLSCKGLNRVIEDDEIIVLKRIGIDSNLSVHTDTIQCSHNIIFGRNIDVGSYNDRQVVSTNSLIPSRCDFASSRSSASGIQPVKIQFCGSTKENLSDWLELRGVIIIPKHLFAFAVELRRRKNKYIAGILSPIKGHSHSRFSPISEDIRYLFLTCKIDIGSRKLLILSTPSSFSVCHFITPY